MVAETARMGKKKPQAASGGEQRKPFKTARIRIALADVAERAADNLAQDFTQYVNDAVRMRLERDGLWPPKPKGET
jgi:hypothetical protein